MRKRTRAREFTLQILYQVDITKGACEDCLNNFWDGLSDEDIEEDIRFFASDLTRGVIANLEYIDAKITQHATNWNLRRMAVVDRNILRLGCYELLFREDIPPKVSINEAVELAKKYASVEASKFVNGILDKIKPEKSK